MRIFRKNNFNNDIVTVENFGAIGDGVTDDTQAFINAVTFCNENNRTLTTLGKSYLVKAKRIFVDCNIDFANATLIIDGDYNEEGIDNLSGKVLFQIGSENTTGMGDVVTFDYNSLSKDKITNSDFYGKGFSITTPLSLGKRWGTGVEEFYKRFIAVDDDGNILNGEYEPSIIAGNYTVCNVRPLNEKAISLKNVIIKSLLNCDFLPTFALILRNNVTIENISIDYPIIENTAYNRGIIQTNSVSGCTIKNVKGINPYGKDNAGYILEFANSDNITVNDVLLGHKKDGSWGSFGVSFTTNLIIDRCYTQRVDMHHVGNYTVKNSFLNYAEFSGGYGNITFENCTFNINVNDRKYGVNFRNDYMMLLSGSLVLKDCILKTKQTGVVGIKINANRDMLNSTTFNFKGLNVVIERTKMEGLEYPVRIGIKNNEWSEKIKVTYDNLESDTTNIFNNDSGLTNYIESLNIINSKFTGENNGVIYFANCIANSFNVINSNFVATLEQSSAHDPNISIINSRFKGLNVRTTNSVKVIGNTITSDTAILERIAPKSKCYMGNIIEADTNENLSSWNVYPDIAELKTRIEALENA